MWWVQVSLVDRGPQLAELTHTLILGFFQAEDGIRDYKVTGVQTCALPIYLEPCCHQGRTGPCTAALIQAGVARVVAALEDPNPLVAGDGLRQLRAAGIQTEIAAAFSAEAEKLNEAFVHFMRT